MRLLDVLNWVHISIVSQRKRAFLTFLGFAVGIIAVVLMNAIGQSLKLYVLEEFTQFGSNIITINPGKTETFGVGGLLNTVRPLSLEDSIDLRNLHDINYTVPVIAGTAKVKADKKFRYTDVIGVNHMASNAWKLPVASGTFLPSDNELRPRSLAVLGSKVKQSLFGHSQAINQFIHIGGQRFRIVGVLAEKGQFVGQDLDEMVYIPTAVAMQLFNRESLMEIDVFYKENIASENIAKKISQRLIARHGREDFTLITQDDMLASLDNILSIIKIAGSALGLISLFVGSVGIATIMLITVQERTREIGLLRAIGCTSVQISYLFLFEAMTIAVISSLIGCGLVLMILFIVKIFFPTIPIEINAWLFLITVVFSALIGLLSGLYPALQAAKLTPIDALRSE